jgi:hypothetical protein
VPNHNRREPIHRQAIHSPDGSAVAARRDQHHTGGMTDTPTQQTWIPQLASAAGNLTTAPTTVDVYRALALAWHTSRAVAHPASVAAELGWMRLAEALYTAWAELATIVDPPAAVPFEVGIPPITGPVEDSEQLRDAVARLVQATAVALRTHAAAGPWALDAALTTADIAADLDASVEGWP